MKIKVLGAGCPSCKQLHENVLKAVGDNKDITVEYITDIEAMLEAGIMSSPALLIDDKTVSSGRILSEEEIKEYIEGNTTKAKDCTCEDGCTCGDDCTCEDGCC
jgi:small redox-active disulfide protein 2